jgi:pimeloyl-ACP methyl ester carboxylesterase
LAVHDGLIDRLAGYEDPAFGIRERFLTPDIGGGRTVAVLSEPTGRRLSFGWVVCHSYGLEQENLQSFESHLARRLARAGSPVMRFHSQGYGDSELPIEHAGLESHIRDARDAAALMGSRDGVRHVGLIGTRFGGTIAALAADRSDATAIALLDPVVQGRPYMRSMIRSALATGLARSGSSRRPQEDPLATMDREGSVDVHGYPLRKTAFDEICRLDVARDIHRFRGRSLVVQVSRSAMPRKDIQRLVQRLGDLGGQCSSQILTHEDALRLGLPRLRAVGTSKKEDTLAGLAEVLTSDAESWCAAVAADPFGGRP